MSRPAGARLPRRPRGSGRSRHPHRRLHRRMRRRPPAPARRRRRVRRVRIIEVRPQEEGPAERSARLLPCPDPGDRAIGDRRRGRSASRSERRPGSSRNLVVVSVESAGEAELAVEHERADERRRLAAGVLEERRERRARTVEAVGAVQPDAGRRGNRPVIRLTCAGSVSGAVVRAARKRAPRAPTALMAGVSAPPTRSARSVSTVIEHDVGGGPRRAGVSGARRALTPPGRDAQSREPQNRTRSVRQPGGIAPHPARPPPANFGVYPDDPPGRMPCASMNTQEAGTRAGATLANDSPGAPPRSPNAGCPTPSCSRSRPRWWPPRARFVVDPAVRRAPLGSSTPGARASGRSSPSRSRWR